MDTCICKAESFHCSPETMTTLLIGCTTIQNKKKLKKRLYVKKNDWKEIHENIVNILFNELCMPPFSLNIMFSFHNDFLKGAF